MMTSDVLYFVIVGFGYVLAVNNNNNNHFQPLCLIFSAPGNENDVNNNRQTFQTYQLTGNCHECAFNDVEHEPVTKRHRF